MVGMLTRGSILTEYIRLGKLYRDVEVEVFKGKNRCTVIIYCDVKPNDDVRLSIEFDRLIVCVGREKINYEDESIDGFEYEAYKYIFKIPIEKEYKIKNYRIDKETIIINLSI